MTIWLPPGSPAEAALRAEGIAVNDRWSSNGRDRRPLQIALLNLMPEKAATETQFARLLNGHGRDVVLTLIVPDNYSPRTTPKEHLDAFYRRWSDVRKRRFDGLIVTGAPIEHLAFEDVDYWPDMTRIFDWARDTIPSTLYICWAGQAALYHFHGVVKSAMPQKLSGVFQQGVKARDHRLMASFQDVFPCPVSRGTEVRGQDLPRGRGIQVLAESRQSGPAIVDDGPNHAVYGFNHLEYDAATLGDEYKRDLAAGREPCLPENYYPADDRSLTPAHRWRHVARRFFANWIDHIAGIRAGDTQRRSGPMWWRANSDAFTPDASDIAVIHAVVSTRDGCADSIGTRLVEIGQPPVQVHAESAGKGDLRIALQLPTGGEEAMERAARAVAAVPGVRRVTYRTPEGAGGCLVSRPRADSEPEDDASEHRHRRVA
ncbi:MAG: homoserine O-succinyltransferase [Alphaproteobacteria bacterium]|nr:homoserine O-succinyltransferase [Alphaproteobacteria bacterium]